jgi:hypothetical protein
VNARLESLVARIAEEHATWDDPVVCREVFGTTDAEAIARVLDDACRTALGVRVVGARFYRVSVGCVAGLELEDRTTAVVKVNRGDRPMAFHEASSAVRAHLAGAGFPCPLPLAPPLRVGTAVATFERLLEAGEPGDAHDPTVRGAVAASLAELVGLARGFAAVDALRPAWFTAIPAERLWPRPHSPLFDFDATAAGAAWIDDLARRARSRAAQATGPRVVGHFDWRVEHLRFAGGRVVASYDWDSLHSELETVLVGAAAHGFTADWTRRDVVPVPALDEMRGFVADYERARGAAFTPTERRVVAASLVYSLGYTARCCHARGDLQPRADGDFRPVLRAHGEEILDAF